MKFCKRCLYTTDHPFGLVLDHEGICSGCRIHEEKDKIDWEERKSKVLEIVEPFRSKSGKNYDCIVPVSGGYDSYYTVHLVKNILGLHPLLVTYNKYYNTPTGIWNLSNLRRKFNLDILIQNVNPESVKRIVRRTFAEYGSIYWHCIAGQTVFPVQTSIRYRIPLVIWGAHQGLEQVGMFSHLHEVEMSRRYRKDHDLFGVEADDMLSIFGSITEEDIWQYRYPDDFDLHSNGTRGIYLGNYFRWDPKAQHEEMIRLYDYRTATFSRTFDQYDFVDCFNYMNLHDLLKLYKTGYSKVTDHATREIRHGRITREEGIRLVLNYENREIESRSIFQDWLGLDPLSTQFLMDRHRNLNFWEETGYRKWQFTGPSTFFSSTSSQNSEIRYISNPGQENKNQYITIGKGYP
ncbi:N-acetyl sugar amidotransferase [Leptospira yasudae]|nr:N-acetyl sugar amidotransferase [Leptospira yasudae]